MIGVLHLECSGRCEAGAGGEQGRPGEPETGAAQERGEGEGRPSEGASPASSSFSQLAKQHKVKYFETSAWTNVNITEAFTALTEDILANVSTLYVCVSVTVCVCVCVCDHFA